MKNYSDTICSKKNRTLSAKGYKFQTRLIDIIANNRGLTRYHSELNPVKEQIKKILENLFIDRELSIEDVKEIIKKSICPEIENLYLKEKQS